MKDEPHKKLLVLVDGSDRSINTVRYVGRNKAFHSMRIVLFHVFSAVPEYFWDGGDDIQRKKVVKQAGAWKMSQEKIIKNYMIQAKQLLVKSGISSASIETKVQKRKKGVARDIIKEAQNGYAAVVARRRGVGALRGIVLGSVAAKLTEKIVFLPLVIVGKKPSSNKILIGFDGSHDSMQAVDFVGSALDGFDYSVELLHVIRGNEHGLKDIASSFSIATKKLISSGFKSKAVSTKIIKGKISRAKTIADYARKHDFGTIVMGRKGRSRTRDFFIGRVTNKVIHMARDRSVWIIR